MNCFFELEYHVKRALIIIAGMGFNVDAVKSIVYNVTDDIMTFVYTLNDGSKLMGCMVDVDLANKKWCYEDHNGVLSKWEDVYGEFSNEENR